MAQHWGKSYVQDFESAFEREKWKHEKKNKHEKVVEEEWSNEEVDVLYRDDGQLEKKEMANNKAY